MKLNDDHLLISGMNGLSRRRFHRDANHKKELAVAVDQACGSSWWWSPGGKRTDKKGAFIVDEPEAARSSLALTSGGRVAGACGSPSVPHEKLGMDARCL